MSRFRQLHGSTTVLNGQMFRLACCDCGLVHNVTIKAHDAPDGTWVRLTMTRNEKNTRARRKSKKHKAAPRD